MMKYRLIFVCLILALFSVSSFAADVTLVSTGSTWKYRDNGSNQGTSWRALAFDDATWSAGAAQLGYGDADEATIVSYGPDPNAKYITTYFRQKFFVGSPSAYTGLTLNLLKDDGAVVYLNGTEIHRVNMPAGSISYTTPASTALGTPQEATF